MITAMSRLIVILCVAPAPPGQTVEERRSKVEQAVRELRADNAQLRK